MTVNCSTHGVREEAFVCQHIALSLQDGAAARLLLQRNQRRALPGCMCGDCDRLVVDGPWTAELETIAGITLICSGCTSRPVG